MSYKTKGTHINGAHQVHDNNSNRSKQRMLQDVCTGKAEQGYLW